MTDKKQPSAPGSSFTGKDADKLIAAYGRAPSAEKKATLLAKLKNERTAFEKTRSSVSPKQSRRGIERG
jgi:hypothetical protein